MRHGYREWIFVGLLAALQSAPLFAQNAAPAIETAQETALERKKPVRNPALYSTRVELLSQSDTARNAAYAKALVQVVNQLTGRTDAGRNPVIRGALPNAPKWVKKAARNEGASDNEGNTLVGGSPVLKASLRVEFEPNPVDSLIAAAGFKYWTGERPKPLLWLSIDDGRGPRLVTAKQLNVIKSLADRGTQRGIRFLVPAGSEADQLALPAVLNLDGKALAVSNARYGNDTFLIGKVYRSVSGWSAWWALWQGNEELARWPVTKAYARALIATGADNVADFFAKRDATRLDEGRSGLVYLEISGIRSAEDYARGIGYLQSHASVRDVDMVRAEPGRLLLRVDLRSGVNAFRGLMRSGSTLLPLGQAPLPSADIRSTGTDAADSDDATGDMYLERFSLRNPGSLP